MPRAIPMAERRPVVLYDADCGFCTRAAHAMTGRIILADVTADPFQRHDLAAEGLTAEACARSLHVLGDGSVYTGAAAVARVLRAGSLPWRLVGAMMSAPGVRWLAERVYTLVARFRHRLPGSTASCELR